MTLPRRFSVLRSLRFVFVLAVISGLSVAGWRVGASESVKTKAAQLKQQSRAYLNHVMPRTLSPMVAAPAVAVATNVTSSTGSSTAIANRQPALAMRWLRESARKRSEKSMGQRLAAEMLEASENRGGAVKKRDEVHRMAEANKAFAHFRF